MHSIANPAIVNLDRNTNISVHSRVHRLQDTWDAGAKVIRAENFQTVLRAAGKTETTQNIFQDWFQLDKGDIGFQHIFFIVYK
jgi:hypothetical protein